MADSVTHRNMELLASLPTDLVAVADSSARAAAPLLRPAEADGDTAALPASFDACLALLAMPVPAGEAWPAAGKELPAPSVEALAAAPPPHDSDAFAALEAEVGLRAALQPVAAAGAGGTVPGLSLLPGERAPRPPADGVQVGSGALVPEMPPGEAPPGEVPPAAPAPRVTEGVPLEAAEPASQAAPAEMPELASWLDSLVASDERASRFASTAEQRLSAARSYSASAAAPAAVAGQPGAEAAVAANGLRRSDAPKVPPPLGVAPAEAPSVPRPEWLPPQAAATSAAPATSAPGPPVDVRTPGWQETFANRVQWLVDSHVDEARITLHPPELGAVDVEISLVDDKTYVQLTAATAAARDELSQSLPRLRELFTVSGLELGGASVHDGRDGQRAGNGNGASSSAARSFTPLAQLGDEPPAQALAARPLGRIDVFA